MPPAGAFFFSLDAGSAFAAGEEGGEGGLGLCRAKPFGETLALVVQGFRHRRAPEAPQQPLGQAHRLARLLRHALGLLAGAR